MEKYIEIGIHVIGYICIGLEAYRLIKWLGDL